MGAPKRLNPATTDASGGATYSNPVPIDHTLTPVNVSIQVVVTGTVNYEIQFTDDEVRGVAAASIGSLTWRAHPDGSNLSATSEVTISYPVAAVRIKQNSGSGSTKATIMQGGRSGC